jgi:hypothetical protein
MTVMRVNVRRAIAAVTAMTAGGYLTAGPGTSCSSYLGESAFVATDFCFIFDCQNGILGGTIDPCSGIGSGNNTVEGEIALPLFTDCPFNGP